MRGAEAVEEMQERQARFKRGDMRNERQVACFLHGVGAEHRPTRGAACHDVGVVAEDGESVRRKRASRNMHDRGRQFAGDLVHVGDHQEKSLGSCECGGECSRLKGTVERTGSATFTLEFFDDGDCAPDVFLAFGFPLIAPLRHRGRWRDRIDRDNLGESICD